MRQILVLMLAALAAGAPAAVSTLEIYTIDVEGGKAVLAVSPSGESMLIDAGWPALPAREASTNRIVAAAKAAGLQRIDYLVISHFDADHLGDVPALVSRFPVGRIFDHGEIQFSETITDPAYQTSVAAQKQRFEAYAGVREKIAHMVIKPGDKIPIHGVDVLAVTAGGKQIGKPVGGSGASNPLCDTNPPAALVERDVEDNLSIGLLISFGKFRMLDLADLEARSSRDLVCPANLIGDVDVYHVNVHGQFKGIAPELVGALRARVMIQGNGARKGADPPSWPILRGAPGLEDIWQVHYSAAGSRQTNPPDSFIANLAPADEGYMIQVSAEQDGSFRVSNTRNGFSKTYLHR